MEQFISRAATVFLIFVAGAVAFPLLYMIFTGDFPGAAVFYGVQEDHEFVNTVLSIREFFV